MTTSPFKDGSVIPGSTPAEVAAWMVTSEEWRFADNPISALSHAVTRAAQASIDRRHDQARFWIEVSVALIAAADSPHVARGEVLTGLVER